MNPIMKILGKYKYPITNFGFEKHPERLIRDREVRPRLDLSKYVKSLETCPECGGDLLDIFRGYYGCETCPYVDWNNKAKVIHTKRV